MLTIILRGDFSALADISFNRGIMFGASLVSFGLYSALIPRRPKIHQLSLISFTTCCGALMLLPVAVWEFANGVTLKLTTSDLCHAGLHADLPSRSLSVLQPRRRIDRPEPRGAVLPSGAGVRLGDGDPAARRNAGAVSSDRLRPGARRRHHRLTAGARRSTGHRYG